MTNHTTNAKQALEAKLRELTQSREWRDSIAVGNNADPLDTTQWALDLEMTTRGLDRNATLVRQIRAAIDRVNQGDYGMCLDCEEPISHKRLGWVTLAGPCISWPEDARQST